jgi:hypothetical protein
MKAMPAHRPPPCLLGNSDRFGGQSTIISGSPTTPPESLDPQGTCCVGYNLAHAWHSAPVQN